MQLRPHETLSLYGPWREVAMAYDTTKNPIDNTRRRLSKARSIFLKKEKELPRGPLGTIKRKDIKQDLDIAKADYKIARAKHGPMQHFDKE